MQIHLTTLKDTEKFAKRISKVVNTGDVIALSGEIGAGKTTFARAFLSGLLEAETEVPSPTFSLVQTYETRDFPVWHFDLYRLDRPEDAWELGIEDAFASGVSLIEWPDRLGTDLPANALKIYISAHGSGEGRIFLIEADDQWHRRLAGPAALHARADAAADFLKANHWAEARRAPLAGDASFRRYERLYRGERDRAVFMDAPPPKENVGPFIQVAGILKSYGYSVPQIIAADRREGFLLLEDLGDDLFARVLEKDQSVERTLYAAAVDLLADLHRRPLPDALPAYGVEELIFAPDNILDWYLPAQTGEAPSALVRDEFHQLWREALGSLMPAAPVLVLRDYHAENLLWLPERSGLARIGLLDFQDGAAGHRAYDLVSLLQDARRVVAPALEREMQDRYIAATKVDRSAFLTAYAVIGAARNSRVLGLWPRLWRRDAKPQYLRLIPHTWALLERNLGAPALHAINRWYLHHLPLEQRRQKFPGAPL